MLAIILSLICAVLAAHASQLHCHIVASDAPYMYLQSYSNPTGSLPGFNSTYRVADALKAIGSKACPRDNPYVLINSGPFEGDNFAFYACSSSYMRYPSQTNGTDNRLRYYGHLRPAPLFGDHANGCVARRTFSGGIEFLVNQTCSMLDDASQENQYWQLEVLVDNPQLQDVDYRLTQISHPQGTSGAKYYFAPGTDAAPAIVVSQNQKTGYRAGLEYIHIN